MKRHVQTTGVRNWSGDAFVELQREPLMALEAVLQDLGDCIVQGCQVSLREDGTYDVSSGYVALQGIDRGVLGDQSAQRILLMPFAGVQGVAMPMYIVPQETVVNRVYNDGASKPIAYVWQAVYSASQPEAGGYVTLTAAGGRSWRDAMQDSTHRMVSDTKINAWDAKADKSGTYPNMTVGHASAADTATSADSATKATQDSDGNKISDTYLKRSGGTMTGNLALPNEVRVNGAVGNLIGRFTWAGGLKVVVGNAQDTLALLSNGDATLNGVAILSGTKSVKTGTPAFIPGRLDAASGVLDYYKTSELTVKAANQDANGNDIPTTYATKDEIPANLPPSGGASGDLKGSYPDPIVKQVTGEYTNTTSGYGGWNPPSNFPKQKILWRMMVSDLKNKALPLANWMIMDPYSGGDVNYLSGIGVTREATPRAFIVSGVRGGTEPSDWSDSLELATQTWVTSKLPAKATTQADGLMSKEDKASLDYLSDTAGKLVILGEVTEVAELNGHPCTIKSKTAPGVTVEVIRTLSGFNINHNLGEDIFVSITPRGHDFNYSTSIWENTITVSASSKWPYDVNNINWDKFAFAVFKYK